MTATDWQINPYARVVAGAEQSEQLSWAEVSIYASTDDGFPKLD